MAIKYTHTNIVSKNWKALAEFYTTVFDCILVPPERNLSGSWLDEGTGVQNASIRGVHLRFPGHGDAGPTLEIYQYANMEETLPPRASRKGFGHIAFHVDDVHAMAQKILDNHGSALGKISIKDIEGVGRLTFVYMCDPEGNILELQNWS